MKRIHMIDAINEALHEEMERDESVFIIAEDVGEYGGVWNASTGLYEKYGAMRAMDTPISEAGFTGLCVGAAMAGLRPVTEIMYMDFITACMDQLVNQAAKADLMSGWQIRIPMVVRTQYGIGSREAAQHSQSLEGWFCQTPGFKVIIPSNAADAKGLLKSAIRDDTPCIFMENRNLYYDKSDVPEDDYTIPLGKANIVQSGSDITIVTYGMGVEICRKAIEGLNNVSCELIDLRTVVPMDFETILASVRKTGRLLIVHEAAAPFSVGAEIVRRVVEEAFDYLDAEPLVYGNMRTAAPFAPNLEDAIMVTPEGVRRKMARILTGVADINVT
ncbi:MAG: alpha-ketoacid dehydrogenase subunit beta [Clostridia bacterium]|nr:alpha-ketoacid dehydrogenase subunit beta [Clostridia bacterium]